MPTDQDPAPLAGVIGEVMQRRGITPARAAAAEAAPAAERDRPPEPPGGEAATRAALRSQLARLEGVELPDEPDPADPTLPTKAEVAALQHALLAGEPLPAGWTKLEAGTPDRYSPEHVAWAAKQMLREAARIVGTPPLEVARLAANLEAYSTPDQHEELERTMKEIDAIVEAAEAKAAAEAGADVVALPAAASRTDMSNERNILRASYDQAQVVQAGRLEEINRLSLLLGEPVVPPSLRRCLFCHRPPTHVELLADGPPLAGANPAPAVEGVDKTAVVEIPLCETHAKRRSMLRGNWALRDWPALPAGISRLGERPFPPVKPVEPPADASEPPF